MQATELRLETQNQDSRHPWQPWDQDAGSLSSGSSPSSEISTPGDFYLDPRDTIMVSPEAEVQPVPEPEAVAIARAYCPEESARRQQYSKTKKPVYFGDCNKKCPRPTELHAQEKRHTEPHDCEKCGYSFGRTQDLKRHRHSCQPGLHGALSVPCEFEACGKAFTRKDNRLRHQRRKHGVAIAAAAAQSKRTGSRGQKDNVRKAIIYRNRSYKPIAPRYRGS
ncbi:hypothetical protein BX600DRAFT_511514 [Xylariales sp. PMI_506]|nr:hypothetical protein BX600DRAFT_511514 [Xylariales sp. PMI_506]